MIQQPRVPSSGLMPASDVVICAKEILWRILWQGQEKIMADVMPPEDWDKSAGIKVIERLFKTYPRYNDMHLAHAQQRSLLHLMLPDVEGCKENKCELTRTPHGRRFISEELNSFLDFLFELIVARGPSAGFDVSLNGFDLFHGHVFIAAETRRLGILFHDREYPAYDKEIFPYNMGYCQTGSTVAYDSMNLRNILWLAPLPSSSIKAWAAPGTLVVLDARPDGIIYTDLIPEYVNFARTIYEDDLGHVVVDVNYLNVGIQFLTIRFSYAEN
ncbi:uncharacterized protein LOC133694898 [Populus nigra]|uniref:uncharacterized protein LOC133694898 n=1 Tax=Populus nigra TaxID=3691 RepID=UPI002B26BF1E|nr:uncharacterized protein LOC133694898 [Populus nigra]